MLETVANSNANIQDQLMSSHRCHQTKYLLYQWDNQDHFSTLHGTSLIGIYRWRHPICMMGMQEDHFVIFVANRLIIMRVDVPIPKPMMIRHQYIGIASSRGIHINNIMLRPISINEISISNAKEKLRK